MQRMRIRNRFVAIGVLIAACTAVAAVAQDRATAASLHAKIATHLELGLPGLVELRRDLHRHPELSGEEQRTAGIVANRLGALGLDVRMGVAGHGVVGILTGGRPGPLVAYRADMDAVRSGEPDPVEFRSRVAGIRHICGHDVHVTIGLGLAAVLASVRADLPGRVMFIFQPSEERATGARAMLDAGLFAKEKPVAIYGLHAAPFAAGRVGAKAGRMMHPNAIAPGAINDDALFAAARSTIVSLFGTDSFLTTTEPPLGYSEDFGYFQQQTPGVFFFLGAGASALPHSPGFAVDEAAIPFGVRAMAAVLLERLTRTPSPPSPSKQG